MEFAVCKKLSCRQTDQTPALLDITWEGGWGPKVTRLQPALARCPSEWDFEGKDEEDFCPEVMMINFSKLNAKLAHP